MDIHKYKNNIFINCPFDNSYLIHFHAITFVIIRCGFIPKCALEHDDASEMRLEKLIRLIKQCKYGIHDISCTQLDSASGYPRFNMPFELGIFLAAKKFGTKEQKEKNLLVFEKKKYSSKIYLSDLNGIDPKAHENDNQIDYNIIIKHIRNWLATSSRKKLPGFIIIQKEFENFYKKALPDILTSQNTDLESISFNDYCTIVEEWLIETNNN